MMRVSQLSTIVQGQDDGQIDTDTEECLENTEGICFLDVGNCEDGTFSPVKSQQDDIENSCTVKWDDADFKCADEHVREKIEFADSADRMKYTCCFGLPWSGTW